MRNCNALCRGLRGKLLAGLNSLILQQQKLSSLSFLRKFFALSVVSVKSAARQWQFAVAYPQQIIEIRPLACSQSRDERRYQCRKLLRSVLSRFYHFGVTQRGV